MSEVLAIIVIIISLIAFGVIYYLQQNKKIDILSNSEENFEQVSEIEEQSNVVDWSITQHIGWLYKNGSNKDFDSMNLYFDQSNAGFFAIPLHQEIRIDLNIEMARKGENVELNGESYLIVFPEETEE